MKSHITCGGCGNTSVTFDPFSSLSLPIPIDTFKTLRLLLSRLSGAQEVVDVRIDFNATVADLKMAMAEQVGLSETSLLHICGLLRSGNVHGKIQQTLADRVVIKDMFRSASEVFVAYELPVAARAEESAGNYNRVAMAVPGTIDVLFVEKASARSFMSTSTLRSTSSPRRLFLASPRTGATLYAAVNGIVTAVFGDSAASHPCPFELFTQQRFSVSPNTKDLIPNDDNALVLGEESTVVVCVWREGIALEVSRLDTESFDFQIDQVQSSRTAPMSLLDCLDKFSESEQLQTEETFFCSKCKQHLPPRKKLDIWAVPDVLIVHLKRFQYSKGIYFVQREKITDLVEFPLQDLDLRGYVKGPVSEDAPPVYDLFAVSEHSGGLGGGHYTATCKNFIDDKWYDFNDSIVSSSAPDRCITPQAYVLFYRRKKGTLRWGGLSVSSSEEAEEDASMATS